MNRHRLGGNKVPNGRKRQGCEKHSCFFVQKEIASWCKKHFVRGHAAFVSCFFRIKRREA